MNFDLISYPGGNDNSTSNFLGSITSTLQRFSGSLTIPNVGNTNIQPCLAYSVTPGDVNFTLRIGLPQMEQVAGATSPILTSGSAVTRAQDVLTLPLTSLPGWNPNQGGVLVASYRLRTKHDTDFPTILLLNDGTSNNQIALSIRSNGKIGLRTLSAGATLIAIDGDAEPALFVRDKVSVGWSPTHGALSHNGGVPVTQSGTFPLPAGLTTMFFGKNGSGGLDGTIESIAYYSGERPDAIVQAISAI
jgi:hypothetical protein